VTRREWDVTLQDAFKSLADVSGPEVSDDLREQIWFAVSGQLPAAERRALIERTATDAAAAEAWRVAHEMWLAFQPVDRVRSHSLVARWISPRLAAAAVLVVATTVGIVSLITRPSVDEFRAAPGYGVTALVPSAAVLPRDGFRLRWTPALEGSRYQVRVTTDDLQVLATATDLSGSEFMVPSAQLAALSAGATVFWQVDVSLPTGEHITSPTFVVHVK
jgi:hypothetical protein